MLFSRIQGPLVSAVSVPRLASIPSRKALSTTFPRGNTSPPSNQTPSPNPDHGEGSSSFKETASRYKIFVGPFTKVFLGAIFTYQVIYWTWLKLEMDEAKVEKNQEVSALEKTARELTTTSK